MSLEIEKIMVEDEVNRCGINKLSANEKENLAKWGLRMFGMGQHTVGDIEEIKYGGRLIILDDGSRWEVDEFDASTAEFWSEFEKVVVIDGDMYLLNESDKVSVQEDS